MYENIQQEYDRHTYQLVVCVAFLIGVPENKLIDFPNTSDTLKALKENDNALIIRSLCNIRSNLMAQWKQTEFDIVYTMKNLDSQPLYKNDIALLKSKNIDFVKANCKTDQYVVSTNISINQYINNIKDLFPDWLNWNFVKQLFLMPNGNNIESVKREGKKFVSRISEYPFQKYINLKMQELGNVLYNDEKFVKCLYSQNGTVFQDYEILKKAPDTIKTNIYKFVEKQEEIIVAVDCENSDVFKLASVLTQLKEQNLRKIKKIVLFDDVNTTPVWKYLQTITGIPVEYVLVERIKQDKSLVDMKICAEITKERYKNNINSFILVSSDSDYWGLISSLEDTEFLVMIESEKCGKDIKRALIENGTYYCNIDKFGMGAIIDLKITIIEKTLKKALENLPIYNLNDLLYGCYENLKITVNKEEHKNLMRRCSSKIAFKLTPDGDYVFDLKALG